MMNTRILVIDDEPQIRKFLTKSLETSGYTVIDAPSVFEARAKLWAKQADLALLDLQLPDGSGLSLLNELREWSDIPVIVLTVQNEDDQKVAALDSGADDYLTKPFSLPELLARIRVLLRRREKSEPDVIHEFGDIRINLNARTVEKNTAEKKNTEIHLTDLEFRLLSLLLRNRGRVLTHRMILRDVWGPNQQDDLQYLRMYIAALRKKLEEIPAQPKWILTEPGVGYRFRIQ